MYLDRFFFNYISVQKINDVTSLIGLIWWTIHLSSSFFFIKYEHLHKRFNRITTYSFLSFFFEYRGSMRLFFFFLFLSFSLCTDFIWFHSFISCLTASCAGDGREKKKCKNFVSMFEKLYNNNHGDDLWGRKNVNIYMYMIIYICVRILWFF
jgi:hypothetical protein